MSYMFCIIILLCHITKVGCVVRTIALAKGQTMPIGNVPHPTEIRLSNHRSIVTK